MLDYICCAVNICNLLIVTLNSCFNRLGFVYNGYPVSLYSLIPYCKPLRYDKRKKRVVMFDKIIIIELMQHQLVGHVPVA